MIQKKLGFDISQFNIFIVYLFKNLYYYYLLFDIGFDFFMVCKVEYIVEFWGDYYAGVVELVQNRVNECIFYC